MSVKLSNTKLKTAHSEHWRDAPQIVKLRKRLSTRADEMMSVFEDRKAEVMDYQRKRVKFINKITHGDVSAAGLRALNELIARDKAYRSNIVNIQIEVLDAVNFFKEGLSLARRDIGSGAYGVQLRKEYKTVAAQRDAIEHYFRKALKAAKAGDFLIKLIDIVIADIDQSGVSDNRLLRSGELVFHPGRSD